MTRLLGSRGKSANTPTASQQPVTFSWLEGEERKHTLSLFLLVGQHKSSGFYASSHHMRFSGWTEHKMPQFRSHTVGKYTNKLPRARARKPATSVWLCQMQPVTLLPVLVE